MKKVLILVEGQTEEGFVKAVLQPYFKPRDIWVIPTIIETKEVLTGPNEKGGISSYSQIKQDLIPLCHDSSASIITTMVDYYALPDDFPGFNDAKRPKGNKYDDVAYLEMKFADDINHQRFQPYLQLHEFESLLFSSPEDIASILSVREKTKENLIAVKAMFINPELINDDYVTCPSRRIKAEAIHYQKSLYGRLIAQKIGLKLIRSECNHFNEWIETIESA